MQALDCIMTADEIRFWDAVYVAKIQQGWDIYSAAEEADWSVIVRRERWGQTKGIYR